MPSNELVRVRVGQTAMPARRVGENEVVLEDFLALDPGDGITVEGEEMLVVKADAVRTPMPQTRVSYRRVAADEIAP